MDVEKIVSDDSLGGFGSGTSLGAIDAEIIRYRRKKIARACDLIRDPVMSFPPGTDAFENPEEYESKSLEDDDGLNDFDLPEIPSLPQDDLLNFLECDPNEDEDTQMDETQPVTAKEPTNALGRDSPHMATEEMSLDDNGEKIPSDDELTEPDVQDEQTDEEIVDLC